MWSGNLFISPKAIAFGLFVFYITDVGGQISFSKKYALGVAGIFTQIEIIGEYYLLVGGEIPDSEFYEEHLALRKVDNMGEVVAENSHGSPIDLIQAFSGASSLNIQSDGLLSATWRKQFNNSRCSVFRINEDLEIQSIGDYYSPYYFIDSTSFEMSSALPRDIVISPGGDIYLTFNTFKPGTANDFAVFKISPEGEKLWEYVYATDADPDACYSLVAQDDGVVLGVYESGGGTGSNVKKLIKLDSLGVEEWVSSVEFPADEIVGIFWDMIPNGDEFIVASSYRPSSVTEGLVPNLYKVNSAGVVDWESHPTGPFNTNQWMQHLVRTTDGNYVGGAQHFEQMPDYVREEAWIIKVDTSGELVWERKYYWEEGYCQTNKIHDMKATPDGGVIFCGEARQCDEPNGPEQQGWLVKLDEFGCLVLGCHTGVTENENGERVWMRLGPSPVSGGEFFVFVGVNSEQRLANSELRVHDMQGHEVKRIRLRGEGTYAVGCSGWSAGVYLVSLVGEMGEVLQSLKVVM